ncbi:hypothetical protein [Paenibacillus elgii]|uniref:hypothetical protein n=1 Tax=Paenibacillus elgii TaxID=189691 RepID=UPI00203C7601|nr:hypothetical protein [Paenibacillus elgii]MCM3274282.1 hypothetical protein [Paenibacillus elgii]
MNTITMSVLIDVMCTLTKKQETIQQVFRSESISYLDPEIQLLEDLILRELGVPEDNSIELLEKYGDPEGYYQEEAFCRDYITDWFFEFYRGNITKEKLIFNLLNWKVQGEFSDRENT